MKRLPKALSPFLGLVVLASLLALAAWAVRAFFAYVSSVPKELAAPLVAGAATILVATVTVMIGRYFERKKELDALYRDKKTEIYDEFLKEFFGLFLLAKRKKMSQRRTWPRFFVSSLKN